MAFPLIKQLYQDLNKALDDFRREGLISSKEYEDLAEKLHEIYSNGYSSYAKISKMTEILEYLVRKEFRRRVMLQ